MSAPHPRWRTTLALPSSPRLAAAGDAVLVPCFGHGRADTLACFALADGAVRWQVPLDDFMLGSALAGVELAADPEGDAVYLVQDATVAAFAVATGAQRWVTRVPKDPPFESFTLAGPPVVAGRRLLLRSRRSRLVALERRDGTLAWVTGDHEPAIEALVAGDVAISRSFGGSDIRGHELATGAPRWTRSAGELVPLPRGPGAADDLVLLANGRQLEAIDPASGAARWQTSVASAPRAAQVGGVVLVADDGSVRALDAVTGAARWVLPGRGPALVAPLDGATALVVRAAAASVVDVATGKPRDHAGHRVDDHDRVLAARFAAVALTADGGVGRLCALDAGGGLRDQLIAPEVARPGDPAPHGVLQAVVVPGGAVTLDTARELACFGA